MSVAKFALVSIKFQVNGLHFQFYLISLCDCFTYIHNPRCHCCFTTLIWLLERFHVTSNQKAKKKTQDQKSPFCRGLAKFDHYRCSIILQKQNYFCSCLLLLFSSTVMLLREKHINNSTSCSRRRVLHYSRSGYGLQDKEITLLTLLQLSFSYLFLLSSFHQNMPLKLFLAKAVLKCLFQ